MALISYLLLFYKTLTYIYWPLDFWCFPLNNTIMSRLILEGGAFECRLLLLCGQRKWKKLTLIENFSNVIEFIRTCIFPISLYFPTLPSYLLHLFSMKLLLHIIGELNPPPKYIKFLINVETVKQDISSLNYFLKCLLLIFEIFFCVVWNQFALLSGLGSSPKPEDNKGLVCPSGRKTYSAISGLHFTLFQVMGI